MAIRPVQFLFFICLPGALTLITVVISYFIFNSWWIELLSFLMPLILGSIFFLFPTSLLLGRSWKYRLMPALALIVALKPLKETVAFNFQKPSDDHDVSVMSFNAALFNPYRPSTLESDTGIFTSFYDHLRENSAPDILCIQEFYHSSRSDMEMTMDSVLKLGRYSYFFTNPLYNDDYEGLVGAVTFSKTPAIAMGRVEFGNERSHFGHWNDFVVKNDTIRVVNIQLGSMSIRWAIRDSSSRLRNIQANIRHFHDRLRWGYTVRDMELGMIEEFLRNSPYPLILCADINALPYSDSYQRLKILFDNAFERRGLGFGSTYHHFPWFIRIDNQFLSRELDVRYFRTRTDIKISDHYPIEAGYVLRKNGPG